MSSQRLSELEEDKEESVLTVLIENMKRFGKFNLTGKQKKQLLMETLRYELDLPEKLEDLIVELVDILIKVERNEIVFNPRIKKAVSLLDCCGRRK